MNISLTKDLENFVNEKVQSGLYSSPSEVVRESLRLLKEQDELKRLRLEEVRREVMIGVKAGEEGRYTVYNSADEMIDEIKKEVLAEFENRR